MDPKIDNRKKVASLIRLLSSNIDGEIISCVRALGRVCDLNDLGNFIENDKASLAKADMQYLYEAGYKDGYDKGKEEGYRNGLEEGKKPIYRQQDMFGDVIDNSEVEIKIQYCQKRIGRLLGKERDFMDNILHRTIILKKTLSPAQIKWLNDIYKKLGGI